MAHRLGQRRLAQYYESMCAPQGQKIRAKDNALEIGANSGGQLKFINLVYRFTSLWLAHILN